MNRLDDMAGRTLGGRYALQALIGKGAFGAVYRAVQAPLGRTLAVKVIRPPEDHDEVQQRFFREARLIGALRHPTIVELFDFDRDDDLLYMALELVDGQTLRQVIHRAGALRAEFAVHLATQALEGIACAHAANLVHRDLKPENLMVTPDDRVKILDFGIAKICDPQSHHTFQTADGMTVGSPGYMAPEQAMGDPCPASDQYAIGILLFEMLTGTRPFRYASPVRTLMAHQTEPLPPTLEQSHVHQPLIDVVRRALAKQPDARFGSALSMATALRAAMPRTAEMSLAPAAQSPPVDTEIDLAAIATSRVARSSDEEG